ncbi:MFS transporter [Calidifontibacter sp. DB0510]|uniref:MFS transporter n=1 Tax=Metallococcus carri TaxID=1656884 RepID=A0A967B848_9MICO|nr:MFS transporter [Metallococcus carri]NHN57342.1 MFS transporter [Metallococcus carri]NOP39120.1 MFS transporter [Calidifontibacter sp. DB2511S]
MLSSYLPLIRRPGARTFLLGSAIGRLGGAMFGISVVAMISTRTGSYALAGAVSACGLVVLALSAVVLGRLIDRFGQRRITAPLIVWSTVWGIATVLCSMLGAPRWTLFVTYAVSAVVANVGTMSRARWSHLLADEPGLLHTAMSAEQVIDELSFVLGPAIAIGLSTLLFPEAGFIAATACYAIGTAIFLTARSTEPPLHEGAHEPTALAVRNPAILVLTAALFMTGCIFGGNEVTAIAVSKEQGQPSAAGLIVAIFAVGSTIAGLWFGHRGLRGSLATALVVGTAGMFLLEAPVLAVHSLIAIGAVLFVAGAATAPTLIISMQLAQKLVPARQVNEAMSVVLTGLIIGIAAGSAVSGRVIEDHGGNSGFAVPVVAGGIACLLAILGRPLLTKRTA